MRYRVARPFKNPKSSFHWFRLSVPKDLRERVGRTEIRQSLGTRDAAEAAVLEAQLLAKWKTEFRRLRDSIAAEGLAEAPAVVDRFLQGLAHGDLDGVVYGIQKLITTNLLTARGPDEFRARQADLALGFMPDDERWDGWEGDPLSNVIPEERDALIGRIRPLHRNPQALGAGFRGAIQHIQEGRRWDAVRFHVMMISEVTGTEIPFPSEFHDAVAEAFVSRLLNYRSYRWDMELLESVSADLDRSTGPTLASTTDLYPVPAPAPPRRQQRGTTPGHVTSRGRRSLQV